jgi:hypothetical protein
MRTFADRAVTFFACDEPLPGRLKRWLAWPDGPHVDRVLAARCG